MKLAFLFLPALAALSSPILAQSLPAMHWLNAPKKATITAKNVQVQVDGGTDFWRVTHYGFIRDNGHFYY